MFIERTDMQCETRENMRGGEGSVNLLHIVAKEHLPAKMRLFSLVTLEPGCGIGKHEHSGESEVYYALSGEGVLDDNGTMRAFRQGDCSVCRNGEYHSVTNKSKEPFLLLAAIILE